MADFHGWLSWMTFMDDCQGRLSWMTVMDDFHEWLSWMTGLCKIIHVWWDRGVPLPSTPCISSMIGPLHFKTSIIYYYHLEFHMDDNIKSHQFFLWKFSVAIATCKSVCPSICQSVTDQYIEDGPFHFSVSEVSVLSLSLRCLSLRSLYLSLYGPWTQHQSLASCRYMYSSNQNTLDCVHK